MKLKRIIDNCNILYTVGELSKEITSIQFDSRNVDDKTLFVCIKGYKVDGHSFIQSAYEKGARAFLVEDDVERLEDCTYIKVDNTRKAMAIVSANLNNNPTKDLKVIGVKRIT